MDWKKYVDDFLHVIQAFPNQWLSYLLEFILLFLIVYYVLRVLYDNEAGKLLAFYSVALFLLGVWSLFIPSFNTVVFMFSVFMFSMFMLLLFSVEIKRSIWAKGNEAPVPTATKRAQTYTPAEADECIEAIIKACQNMSKNDVGALIVLSNGNLPKQILESGTTINAEISQQMIEGIFFPKAPLHDGAMIIQDHKLQAAGCFLPLTQNNDKYPKELGTRHRAGIGITEVTNVTSIIVSEETGVISIVKQGKIVRYADANMLRNELKEYYWKDFATGEKRKRGVKETGVKERKK